MKHAIQRVSWCALFVMLGVGAPAASAVPVDPAFVGPAPVDPGFVDPGFGVFDDGDDQARVVDGLFQRELFGMVVDEAEGFLADHPRHARADEVRYRLAASLFELARHGDAAPHYRTLARRAGFEYRAESALRLGQCELELDRPVEAADALQTVLDLDVEYLVVPATFLLAEADFRQDRFAQARPRYTEVALAELDGEFALDAAVGLAWCDYRLGDLDEAIATCRALQDGGGGELDREMAFLEGEALSAADRPGEALAAYARVTGGPFADAALRGLGFCHGARDEHEQAAAAFDTLLRRHPDTRFAGEARLRLGIHRLHAGDAPGAWTALDARGVPDDAETRYWKARVRAELADYDGALALLDAAEAARPEEDLARFIHTARGDWLAASGREDEAARAYERAGSSDALHAAAVARLNAGDAARALELIRPLAAAGHDPAVRLTQAEALFALGRSDDAEPLFQLLLEDADAGTRVRAASRLAWCAYQRGDAETAARRFARVSRDHPAAPEATEALFMEGRCHKEAGDLAAATVPWERYLVAEPAGEHRAEVLFGLARSGGSDAGLDLLRTVVGEHGDSAQAPHALLALADADAAAGKRREAERGYRQLIERFGRHELAPAARYGLAWCRVDDGDPDEALALLEPISSVPAEHLAGRDAHASVDPELVTSVLELMLWCEHERGDPAAAERAWSKLAKRARDDDARLLAAARTVANAYAAAGKPLDGLGVYDRLASRDPPVLTALVEGAWLCLDAGQREDAEARLAMALALDADDAAVAEACFFVGESHFSADDHAGAVPWYAAAARAGDSRLPDEATYKEGFARLSADDVAAAGECFERLVRRFPDSPLVGEALFLAGEAAFRQGDFERAVPWLERLLSEYPGHQVVAKGRFRLGVALGQLERWQESEAVLADLARQSDGFENATEAELWRGRALAANGKDRAARGALQGVVSADRGILAARAQIELGRLELQAGEVEAALSAFLKVAVLYGHDEEVAEALLLSGECLEKLGDRDRAHDRYREILDKHAQTTFAAQARSRLSR